jgi:hypothetical protein
MIKLYQKVVFFPERRFIMQVSSTVARGAAAASPERANRGSALERQIAFLQKQAQSLKENKQGSADSSDAIKDLEKQISELQQQLNQEKLQESNQKVGEAQKNRVEQSKQAAVKEQEPDQAVISQQARDLYNAMSSKGELRYDNTGNNMVDPIKLAEELRANEMEPMEHLYSVGSYEEWILEKTLGDQPEEVQTAFYAIINNNFNPSNAVDLSFEEIYALRDTGMAQAQYIADNYITDKNHKDLFMMAMSNFSPIAEIKKTNAELAKIKPSQQDNPELNEKQKLDNNRLNAKSLFKEVNTSTRSDFVTEMMKRFEQLGPNVSSLLKENLQAFARIFDVASEAQHS